MKHGHFIFVWNFYLQKKTTTIEINILTGIIDCMVEALLNQTSLWTNSYCTDNQKVVMKLSADL